MTYFDAHLHIVDLIAKQPDIEELGKKHDISFFTSCDDIHEFIAAQKMKDAGVPLRISYGVHPWNLSEDEFSNLEQLVEQQLIDAIGEFGFDFFASHDAGTIEKQEHFFMEQVDLAIEHKLPVILHIRKGMEEIFKLLSMLKMVPSVLFHSFSGTSQDADAILRKGVNAYFSFGTPILKNNKKARSALTAIDISRILLETDAPYQPPAKMEYTPAETIIDVYKKTAEVKKMPLSVLIEKISKNYTALLS